MQEESAISIWKKLPETKAQIDTYTRLIKESVLEGEVDPLLFAAQISALEKLFTNLKSDIFIKDAILSAAEKYGGKPFEKGNAKYSIRETGVSYDYEGCGDQIWAELDNQVKVLTEKRKERETFLKSITGDMTVFGDDGCQIIPAQKRSTTQVVITLK